MLESELRSKVREGNVTAIAQAIGVEATIVRRWMNGGINGNLLAKAKAHFGG
jgi:transposase-like protein